jgi:hypothetical protein
MECLADAQILEYLDGDMNPIKQALIRDHLLICSSCRQTAERYQKLHKILNQPVSSEPPDWLIQQVLKRIYPEIPKLTSIIAMIAAGFVFLTIWIYVYFDFSSNSLIQALQLTADSTSGWLVNIVKGISAVYALVYAAFKACNAFLNVLANFPITTTIVAGTVLAVSGTVLIILFRLLSKKPRESKL